MDDRDRAAPEERAPTGSRHWAVLQHVDHEGPGLIARALDDAGITFEVVRADRGVELPDHRQLDGLVIMGGPMGVHDDESQPWLGTERGLIARMATERRPVLAVCLGAQQLAYALGAEVTAGPIAEIGLGHVELTGAGRRDPVFGPEYSGLGLNVVPCVHWHGDTFSLPDGAVHLAASRAYPHQAFRWGDRAYGLQFHVEVDTALAQEWQPELPPGTRLDAAGLAQVEATGRRLLRRFIDRVTAGAPAAGAGHHAGAGW